MPWSPIDNRRLQLLPAAFVVIGLPAVAVLANRRFPNTDSGDLYRVGVGVICGLVLAALGYLIARFFSR